VVGGTGVLPDTIIFRVGDTDFVGSIRRGIKDSAGVVYDAVLKEGKARG
jgi:hypothetical protein